jgi:hypothetical protein
MGVDREDYIIYGYKFPAYIDKDGKKWYWDDEKYEEYSDADEGEMIFIVDGMNGEYAVFGKLIQKADEFEGLSMEVLEEPETDEQEKLINLAEELFGEHTTIGAPSYIVFTHWH